MSKEKLYRVDSPPIRINPYEYFKISPPPPLKGFAKFKDLYETIFEDFFNKICTISIGSVVLLSCIYASIELVYLILEALK